MDNMCKGRKNIKEVKVLKDILKTRKLDSTKTSISQLKENYIQINQASKKF